MIHYACPEATDSTVCPVLLQKSDKVSMPGYLLFLLGVSFAVLLEETTLCRLLVRMPTPLPAFACLPPLELLLRKERASAVLVDAHVLRVVDVRLINIIVTAVTAHFRTTCLSSRLSSELLSGLNQGCMRGVFQLRTVVPIDTLLYVAPHHYTPYKNRPTGCLVLCLYP